MHLVKSEACLLSFFLKTFAKTSFHTSIEVMQHLTYSYTQFSAQIYRYLCIYRIHCTQQIRKHTYSYLYSLHKSLTSNCVDCEFNFLDPLGLHSLIGSGCILESQIFPWWHVSRDPFELVPIAYLFFLLHNNIHLNRLIPI